MIFQGKYNVSLRQSFSRSDVLHISAVLKVATSERNGDGQPYNKILLETPITPDLSNHVGKGYFMFPVGLIELSTETEVHFNCLAYGSWVGGWYLDYVEFKPT